MTQAWRQHLGWLGAAVAVLLALFWRDAADMAVIWWTSSTYTHCLFILPLVGWLIWQRRDEVALLSPRLSPLGLALAGFAAILWILGEAAGVSLFRHVGLIMMLQASVLTLLGPRVARGLLFPLFYLFFLVPFGEELVPPLQTVTADLCMLFLGWAGIPAHIEGVFISVPTGYYEVAEACAGVKFLVAMLAYGTLVANVCYRSWWRRGLFMALVILVPILTNGIRAYGTIHIAAHTGNEFAESFDHIIYGWVFFAIVMAIVMAIGSRFFDRGVNDQWLDGLAPTDAKAEPRARGAILAGLGLIAAAPLLWQAVQSSLGQVAMPNRVTLPAISGWMPVATQSAAWSPRFDGADHRLQAEYLGPRGERVTLAIALYAWQGDGKEIVGFAQGAADPDSHWSWTNDTRAPPGGKAERIFAPGLAREVVSFYVTGGMTTGRAQLVKLATLKSRLLGRDQAAVAILVSAEDKRNRPARPAIEAFLGAMGSPESVAGALVRTARGD